MRDVPRITQQEVQALPRWARLAFAARCVRRALHLLPVPDAHLRVLTDALTRLEQASAAGRAGDDLADAAASAYTLALDNLDGQVAPPSGAEEGPAAVVPCLVAHATAFAAEAATLADARAASHLVAQSVDFAVHAYRVAQPGAAPQALNVMRADLQQLRSAAS